MSNTIVRFPNSKRKLSLEEEKLVRVCVNLINNSYSNSNPFISEEEKLIQSEGYVKTLVHKIFELNEDKL
jgi:hypothetical protein